MSWSFFSRPCSQYLTSAHAPTEMGAADEGITIPTSSRNLQRGAPHSFVQVESLTQGFGKSHSVFLQCHVKYSFKFRSLKRENPDLSEDVVLIRALRDSNLPKFLTDDAILFR